MVNYKKYTVHGIIGLALLGVGVFIGNTLTPEAEVKTVVKEKVKWKTKTEIRYKNKIVYKDRYRTKYIDRVIEKKDGTIIKEKERTQDEEISSVGVEQGTKKTAQEYAKEKVFVKIENKSSFYLGMGVTPIAEDFKVISPSYDVFAGARVGSSPIWAGVSVKFSEDLKWDGAGITLKWEF